MSESAELVARIARDRYLWVAFALGTGIAAFIQQRPMMDSVGWGAVAAASYLVVDRVQAKRHTGSWLGQPEDLNA